MTYESQDISYKLSFDQLINYKGRDMLNMIKEGIDNGPLTVFNLIADDQFNTLTGLAYTEHKQLKSSALLLTISGIMQSLDRGQLLCASVSSISEVEDGYMVFDLINMSKANEKMNGTINLRGNRVVYLINSIEQLQSLIGGFFKELKVTSDKIMGTLIIQFYIVAEDPKVRGRNPLPFLTFADILIKEQKGAVEEIGQYLQQIQKTSKTEQVFTKVKLLNGLLDRYILSSKVITVCWQIDCSDVSEDVDELLEFLGLFSRTVILATRLYSMPSPTSSKEEPLGLPEISPSRCYEVGLFTPSKNSLLPAPKHQKSKLHRDCTPNLRNYVLEANPRLNCSSKRSTMPYKTNCMRNGENWGVLLKRKELIKRKLKIKTQLKNINCFVKYCFLYLYYYYFHVFIF
eukprot:TRINITY_DN12089_c0_g1_i11.p1 TRINITY_DN12089_c0_g1~~TRINITY_DN12089_c0_g1_i11.p1  ORF type:complete len:402 (+),score=41.83 TRINITY_DN12089_c0_g1_i11:315-1520(+)